MSTLQATNLKHGSSASNNLVLDANGNVTAAGTVAMATPFAMRNKIINGAMEINQRGSASYTINVTGDTYTLDRFVAAGQSADGVYTVQPISDAPAGFIKSALITVTTADASIGSTQYYDFQQNIEGSNIVDFAFGTASAKTITLSFWVKSSLTGSFGGAFRNGSFNRSYPFLYTITNANTWEYKTVTIPGDTTGTWLTDNQNGLNITWSLGDGSSRLSTAGSWQAGNFAGATGQTQIMATNGATWRITGVQLEVGSVATPFERRLYPQELALCQRYYQRFTVSGGSTPFAVGQAYTGTNALYALIPPITMRATPTLTYANVDTWEATGAAGGLTVLSIAGGSSSSLFRLDATMGSSTLVAGNATGLHSLNASAFLAFSAEI